MTLVNGTIVEHNGRRGVVVPDFMNCCLPEETPVEYDGQPGFKGTLTSELTVVGPENPKPDIEKCGAGKGAACCIFLVAGGNGFECARRGSLRNTLIFRSSEMKAKRQPSRIYPDCMDLSDGAVEITNQ